MLLVSVMLNLSTQSLTKQWNWIIKINGGYSQIVVKSSKLTKDDHWLWVWFAPPPRSGGLFGHTDCIFNASKQILQEPGMFGAPFFLPGQSWANDKFVQGRAGRGTVKPLPENLNKIEINNFQFFLKMRQHLLDPCWRVSQSVAEWVLFLRFGQLWRDR